MAIQKSKTLANGATGDYWRIIDISIDRQNLRISGRLALFKDAATSAAGAPPPGGKKTFHFDLVMSEFIAYPDVISFMYSKIMAYAESTIDYDINGSPIDPPRYREPDIVGGSVV